MLIANKKLLVEDKEKEKRATELSLAYLELQKTERSQKEYIIGLEQMLFMVSHEVRQPLAQILGLSSLLDGLNDPGSLKKILTSLKESACQLDVFTKKLTNYLYCLVQKIKYNK